MLLLTITHLTRVRSKNIKAPDVKITVTANREDPSIQDINEYFKSKNKIMKELINIFKNNPLESMIFERLDSIRLS